MQTGAIALCLALAALEPASAQVPDTAASAATTSVAGVALPFQGTRASELLPAEQAASVASVSILQVRPDVYMLTAGGINFAVETGAQGTLVVNNGAGDCQAVVAAVRRVAQGPIRYLVNTSADADLNACNGELASIGSAFLGDMGGSSDAPVIASQNVLLRMSQQTGSNYAANALPSEVFTRPSLGFTLNGQGVQVISMPAAHSDGDTMVVLRRSDVVVSGDVFDITRFPVIDLAHGGSIQGEIDALNELADQLVIPPTPKWEGVYGTLIIPPRGHLCDQADVLIYVDMVTIVRDRIQALLKQGRSLSQVLASDPTRGYTSRYGSDSGAWTTRDFVEAVYKSLQAQSHGPRRSPADE